MVAGPPKLKSPGGLCKGGGKRVISGGDFGSL